jgi:rhodanese-related sulfurtransferase
MEKGTRKLSVAEFETLAEQEGAIILDTRSREVFPQGYIPGSMFIGIDGNFAPWVGALISDLNTPLLLVADDDRLEEVVTRLARVGYDNPVGVLGGGIEAWKAAGKPVETMEEVSAEAFASVFKTGQAGWTLIDVRKQSEYESEHIENATNLPLDFIYQYLSKVAADKTSYLHCAGGYRSLIAASILRREGFENLVNVQGGYDALRETDLPRTDYVAPTTML